MDDRITEIREALSCDECFQSNHRHVMTQREAARAYADLLESDTLIIRRDENGKWPTWICDIMESHYDPRRAFDALASSQGAEPTPDDVEQLWKELHPDSERHP